MVHELRCFLLVLEHGTFTEAARQAHLAQPSLSAAIQRLEDDHGARLLHRGARGARATAAGEALVPHARAVMSAMAAGRRAVAEVEGLSRGQVRVGGGASACSALLPPVLAAFQVRYPGIRLLVTEVATPEVPGAVRAGEVDLGIAEGQGEPWLVDELVLVGAPGSRWPMPVVGLARGASLRAAQDRSLLDADLVMELGSIGAVKGMVRAGMGVALLSRAACAEELALGALVELAHPALPLSRQLCVLHTGEERLSPAARALRDLLLGDGLGASEA